MNIDSFAQLDTKTMLAALKYLKLKKREIHPEGEFDRKKRWFPDPETEEQDCCKLVRYPSAAFPFSLMVHCRTANHVSACFGVKSAEVKQAAKFLESSFDEKTLCLLEKSLKNDERTASNDQ